jgi:hypothetical protein
MRLSLCCTGLDTPRGFQEVEAPRFLDNLHMKVVRLSAIRTGRVYPPGNIPGTHFCYRLSRPQGHSAADRIMPTKYPLTPSGIETATCRLVAQCLNELRHRGSRVYAVDACIWWGIPCGMGHMCVCVCACVCTHAHTHTHITVIIGSSLCMFLPHLWYRSSPRFMELEGSSPRSQDPATCPYPEPD